MKAYSVERFSIGLFPCCIVLRKEAPATNPV